MTATLATEIANDTRAAVGARSDEELVAAVRRGDDAAFERLFERYNPRVAYYAHGMVHDHGRAEDIAQEVFISALRRMRQTDHAIAFKPWIHEIAKNACIDQFRRSQRRREVSYDADDSLRASHLAPAADAASEQKASLDDLCGAFTDLSEMHHRVLVMREFEGLSYDEISERLRMTRHAVESTLFRARRRLAEEYDEIVTGERCRRVHAIVAKAAEASLGARDRRRLAAHISHCQGCRRHAYAGGVDIESLPRTARSRLAVWFPFPLLLRRRSAGSSSVSSPGAHASPLMQWAGQLGIDPAVAGWARAAATAFTVAFAGVGAGAHGSQIATALFGGGSQRGHANLVVAHSALTHPSNASVTHRRSQAVGLAVPQPAGGPSGLEDHRPSSDSSTTSPVIAKAGRLPLLPAPALPGSGRLQPVKDVAPSPLRRVANTATQAAGTQAQEVGDTGRQAVTRALGALPGT